MSYTQWFYIIYWISLGISRFRIRVQVSNHLGNATCWERACLESNGWSCGGQNCQMNFCFCHTVGRESQSRTSLPCKPNKKSSVVVTLKIVNHYFEYETFEIGKRLLTTISSCHLTILKILCSIGIQAYWIHEF